MKKADKQYSKFRKFEALARNPKMVPSASQKEQRWKSHMKSVEKEYWKSRLNDID